MDTTAVASPGRLRGPMTPGVPRHKCAECGTECSKRNLVRHHTTMRQRGLGHHLGVLLTCEHCTKVFMTKHLLEKHLGNAGSRKGRKPVCVLIAECLVRYPAVGLQVSQI
jgi:hypothetical protein